MKDIIYRLYCCSFYFALLLLIATDAANGQLRVQEGIPLDSLVRTSFIGSATQVSNISYRGSPRGIGYFNGTMTNIGINEGVLLTSGWVHYASGSNSVEDRTYDAQTPGDPDLQNLVYSTTHDAAVLEFDFVPFQDAVQFEYVFGSEEYLEYVDRGWNDVFAFFISGPGIAGKQNLALIPGTAIPVTVDNINDRRNSGYYVDNAGGKTIQYDGFTTVLTASATVIPCQTYHLKLAIADVGDHLLDSGVFLKSGSFDAGNQFSIIGLRDAVEDGCQPGIIEIQRLGNLANSVIVSLQILGNATNGSDYLTIPSQVTFQKGQGSIRIPIEALQDSIPDNGEYVTIFIEDICKTGLIRDSIRIHELQPIAIDRLRDTVICQGENLRFEAKVTGGSGIYSYDWNTGQSGRILNMNPASEGVYVYTVTDSLTGCSVSDTVEVVCEPLPIVDAGPEKFICPGGMVQMEAFVSGESPPYQVMWSPMIGLSNPAAINPQASPRQTTTYTLTVSGINGCVMIDTMTIYVSDLLVDAGADTVLCTGGSVDIGGEAAGGVPPYTYQWIPEAAVSNPGASRNIVSPDVTTTYHLRVRSSDSCVVEDSVTVHISDVALDAGPDVRICKGESRVIGASASNTDSTITYLWTPAWGLDNRFVAMPLASPGQTMTYIVTATSSLGCEAQDTVQVVVNELTVNAGPVQDICHGESVRLQGRVVVGSPPYIWRWTSSVVMSDSTVADPVVSPPSSMWYRLTVADAVGCVASDSVLVTVWPEVRPRIDVLGSRIFCVGDSVQLDAGPGYSSYLWSTGESTQRIAAMTTGNYWVEVASTDGCTGGSDTVEVFVSEQPSPRITGPVSLCAGESAVYAVLETTGALYDWTVTGGELLAGQGTDWIEVHWETPGTYSVHIDQVFGVTSCRGDTTLTVVVHPLPEPVIGADGSLEFCEGGEVTLSAPLGFVRYDWATGDTTREVTVSTSGTYRVTVTTAAACTGTSPPVEVIIHTLPAPEIVALSPVPVCEGESVILGLSKSYAGYRWSNGSQGATLSVHSAGTYVVTVTTGDGCSAAAEPYRVEFNHPPEPRILADGPLEFCEGSSVGLETDQRYTRCEWSIGDTTQAIRVRRSGTYTVRVWTAEGCSAEAQPVTVVVHPYPEPPLISRTGDTLRCTPADVYQWYVEVDGRAVPMSGEITSIIRSQPETRYWVRIWNAFSCDTISLPFMWKEETEEKLSPASTVALPVLEAAPGEHVTIDLSLVAQKQLLAAGVRAFNSELRFNGTVLVPVGSTPRGVMVGDQRIIDVSGMYDSTDNLLARLEFLATLGDVSSTPLIIESFAWDNPDVALTRIDGEFRIGVCREGGERLFDGTGTLTLGANHPNPFNSMTVISFEVIEAGRTELYVLDLLGRRVATLLNEDIEPGRYQVTFDAGTLPSGMYVSVLRTPSQVRMRPMRFLK
jgi:hypothetical protein